MGRGFQSLNVIEDDCYFLVVHMRLSTRCKILFTCHDSKNRNRFLMSVFVLATTSVSHRVGLSLSAPCCLLLYNHTRLHWIG